MIDPFLRLADTFLQHGVRFVIIGVWGANYYAQSMGAVLATRDRDLFLPPDPDNLVQAWSLCESESFTLWAGTEPLDRTRDRRLAESVASRRALTTAMDASGLEIDLTLEMAGFEFDDVQREQQVFSAEGVDLPVARLSHIVASKAKAGRPKDRLFLATHKEILARLLRRNPGGNG